MRVVCFAAALLLASVPAVAAGAKRYEGAGFVVDLPDGFDAVEGYTGQIYHLDVIRGGAGAVLLRLVVVPRGDITAAAVAERIATALAGELGAGASPLETAETSVTVAGTPRSATSRTYGAPGKPELRLVHAGIRDGGQKVALVARIRVSEEAAERALLEEILSTLRIRTIGEASLIGVRAATLRFRVPLLTKIEWKNETGRVVGQFGLPEGRMTLVIQDCRTVGRADTAVEGAHEDNGKSLDLSVIRSGGKVLARSMTALPAGDDLVTGSAFRIELPGDKLRDQIVLPGQDGRLFVGFSFLCDAERREEMSARIVQILGSLVGAEPPHRAPNLYLGGGLKIAHGARDSLAVDLSDPDGPRAALDFPGPFPPARILLDVRPAEPEEAVHERELLARGVPAAGRETTTAPVAMLGGKSTLRVTTYPEGAGRRFVATAAAPLGAAAEGETQVTDGPVSFPFDARVAELATSGSRTNRRIEIRGDRVRGSLVRLPTLVDDPEARLPEQIRWADRDFQAEETERGAGEFTEPVEEERTIDGRKVLVSRRTFVGADGRKGAHTAFAAVLHGEYLRASLAVFDVDDAAAVAAARRILERLCLR